MKKLSIGSLVEFRKKSDRAKKTFVENLKLNKIDPPAEGGGDYWVTSLSAVYNSFKKNNLNLIDDKINELKERLGGATNSNTKSMYHRNIANLQNYKGLDLGKLRPNGALSFLKKSTGNPILIIKGLQTEARPSHIYTYQEGDKINVGAIWFTSKVNGYRREEVGMFCDMLYKFLSHNYANKYELVSNYCVAVDMVSGTAVNYSEIERGDISEILEPTLEEISRLL